jgi:multimeric flavodoxin WrbA
VLHGDLGRTRLVGLVVSKMSSARSPARSHGVVGTGYGALMSNGVKALVLVCTLKASPAESSSELLASQVLEALGQLGAEGEIVRVVDHDVRFGVSTDEGDGDGWPGIRQKVLASDVLVVATPIWMGQPSSVCKMVLERLDAELSETDDEGRLLTYGKVAMVAVVGNEDGAHHVVAECLQALNDTGFSIAANAGTYWVGRAMQSVDYKDLDPSPEETTSATRSAAANAVHLARLLQDAAYPAS